MGMFSKKETPAAGPKPKPANTNTKSNQITTLIGEECSFEGNLSSSSSTRIDGSLSGKITGENALIVGDNGTVVGEIKAVETIVYGRVEGVIESKKLEIKKSGVVTGDVIIDVLIVENGGTYNGKCIMNEASGSASFTPSPLIDDDHPDTDAYSEKE